MPDIKAVGIVSKPGVAEASSLLPKLLAWLDERRIDARYDETTAGYLKRFDGLSRERVAQEIQLMIVLGGDGTLLSAARAISGQEIPLFAVNLGGLGFLTAITVEELFPELERALVGDHRIGRRRMLDCELVRHGQLVARYEALNDVVLSKNALARIMTLETHVDNHFVCTYKADGLIISTPTGSTAYSLSAGGPIIFPSVATICISPICPHTLTNRPVLVPDTSVVQVRCHADDDSAYLTIDGQVGEPLKHDDVIVCRSSAHMLSLVRPPRMLFFDVLREKLKWGER